MTGREPPTDEVHLISRYTLMADTVAWLAERGYAGIAVPPSHRDLDGGILFRPADQPSQPPLMAVLGDVLYVAEDGRVLVDT